MVVKRVVIEKTKTPELVTLYECASCDYAFTKEGIFRVELYDSDMNTVHIIEQDAQNSNDCRFYFLENGKTIDAVKIGVVKDNSGKPVIKVS